MKVFIDTTVLAEIALPIDTSCLSREFMSTLAQQPDVSLWTSALSVARIHTHLSKLDLHGGFRHFFQLIQKHFSVIPLRPSTLAQALDLTLHDFECAIQAASAQQLGMDYIITRTIREFGSSAVPVFTPEEFFQKWNDSALTQVQSVPFLDLGAQQHQVYNRIDDQFTEIIRTSGFILGNYVENFEHCFAKIHDVRYCLGVSSGTDALHIALLALGIGPGDEVIVPANTFIATAEAVSHTGATPVFVDCDEYYGMDVECVRDVLTRHTNKIKALIPVHLYGQPANMNEVISIAHEYDLRVIEDCCQAHLARDGQRLVGTFGDFGAFSFYPGKNIGAFGEAGALITNNEELYRTAKMLRQHGEVERYHHRVVGHNYRMEALQGAVLGTKLPFLPEWTEKRRRNARLYSELLQGIDGIETPQERDETFCVYHLYVIQTEARDTLREFLQDHNIATGLHYPIPLHLQEAYESLGYQKGDFPQAERAAVRIVSLPMYPELTEEQILYVSRSIQKFVTDRERGHYG